MNPYADNQFDEVEENTELHDEDEFDNDALTQSNLNPHVAPDFDAILNNSSQRKSYSIREGGALNESQKEFQLFDLFVRSGSGRSHTYISTIYNLSESQVRKIAKKNHWEQRASDYDMDMLAEKLKLEQDSRATEHKRRLEEYRLQQEFLGRSLSTNAAKLAALSQRTLDAYIDDPSRVVDMRDLPGILNSAAKLAEVGKSLQSGALGVEQLLVALEEADIDQ